VRKLLLTSAAATLLVVAVAVASGGTLRYSGAAGSTSSPVIKGVSPYNIRMD
jgi:hypothetical protein